MKSSAISSSVASTTVSRMESRRSSERLCCNPLSELSHMFKPQRKSSVSSIKQVQEENNNSISQNQLNISKGQQSAYQYPRRGSAIQLSYIQQPQENKVIQLMEDRKFLEKQNQKEVNECLSNERQYFSQLKHANDPILIKRRSQNTMLDRASHSYLSNQENISDANQKTKYHHRQSISQCNQKENYSSFIYEREQENISKRQQPQTSQKKSDNSLLLESDLVEEIAGKTMKELKCTCCKSQIADMVEQLIDKVRTMGEQQGRLQITNTKLNEQINCLSKEKRLLEMQIYYEGQLSYVKSKLEETEATLKSSEKLIKDLTRDAEQKKQELLKYQRQCEIAEKNLTVLERKERNLQEQIEKKNTQAKDGEKENGLVLELKEANSALRSRISELEKILKENKESCDHKMIKHKSAMERAQQKLDADQQEIRKLKSSLDMVIQEINTKKAILESEGRLIKERQKQLLEREKQIKDRESSLNQNKLVAFMMEGRQEQQQQYLVGDQNINNRLVNNYLNQQPALNYNLKNTFLPLSLSQHETKNEYRYQWQQSQDKETTKVEDMTNQSRIGVSKSDCQIMRTFNDEPLITQSGDNDSNYNLPSFQQQPEIDEHNIIRNTNNLNTNTNINKKLRISGFDSSPNLQSRNNDCSFENCKTAGEQESVNKLHVRQSHTSVRCFSGGEIDQEDNELRMSALKLNEEIMHKKMEIELQSMVRQKEKLDEREKELKRLEEKIKVRTPTISPTRMSQYAQIAITGSNKKDNAK